MSGNNWGTCDPANPRNRRRRPALLVETPRAAVLVDTPTDLRDQLTDAGIRRIDAVLFTHAHADHVHGMDDLRPMMWSAPGPIRAYADDETATTLEGRFAYAIAGIEIDRGLYHPILDLHRIGGPFSVADLDILPFNQDHGFGRSLGFRFGPLAYSTDVVALDEAAFAALAGVDTWIVDATREEPHPSHAHLALTLEWIARLKPRRAILTHMNHTMDYARLTAMLPAGVEPGYDGLVAEFP
jgi:phosphoribosyl 1,2-cyclic phosphate phosphodiesterase